MFGEPEEVEPVEGLATLRRERSEVERLLIADPRRRHGLWEINSVLVTTDDRNACIRSAGGTMQLDRCYVGLQNGSIAQLDGTDG